MVVDDLSDAQKKIAELEAENLTLKEHLEIRATTLFEDNAICTNDNREPFCSNCLYTQRKLVHLIVKTNSYRSCPNCQNAPQTKSLKTVEITRVVSSTRTCARDGSPEMSLCSTNIYEPASSS